MSKPTPAVYFTELRLRNVRCFGDDEQVLKLTDAEGKPARWTVLLGDNGNGKTTVLECLKRLPMVANDAYTVGRRWMDTDPFDTERQMKILGALSGRALQLHEEYARGKDPTVGHIYTEAVMCDGDGPRETLSFGLGLSRPQTEGHSHLGSATLLTTSYAASRSSANAAQISSNIYDDSSRDNRDRSISEWLRDLDYSAAAATDNTRYVQRRDAAVQVVIDLLPDVTALRFTEPKPDGTPPQVILYTDDGWVPLHRTAYGYQTLFVWVLDLVARLFEHYPDSDDPLSEPAVVLVDEIELHLHPSWQRSVLKFLDEKFPRVQWVVTTHSPLVAQAAPEVGANLAVLRREGGSGPVVIDNSPDAVRGWRVDQVLASDLFGTEPRDEATQAALDRRRDLLRKPKLSAADAKRLGELEAQLDAIPLGESRQEVRDRTLLKETLDLLSRRTAPESPAAGTA